MNNIKAESRRLQPYWLMPCSNITINYNHQFKIHLGAYFQPYTLSFTACFSPEPYIAYRFNLSNRTFLSNHTLGIIPVTFQATVTVVGYMCHTLVSLPNVKHPGFIWRKLL